MSDQKPSIVLVLGVRGEKMRLDARTWDRTKPPEYIYREGRYYYFDCLVVGVATNWEDKVVWKYGESTCRSAWEISRRWGTTEIVDVNDLPQIDSKVGGKYLAVIVTTTEGIYTGLAVLGTFSSVDEARQSCLKKDEHSKLFVVVDMATGQVV